MSPKSFEVVYETRAISCLQYGDPPVGLVFTHGAGGTLSSDAMVNFASGFAIHSSILCFKGNMNLNSRVKMFNAILEDQQSHGCSALGGRSMGARAAVMAATESTKFLILVSYPLRSDKGELRDKILLDIPAEINVLFISGDGDGMCELGELNGVRQKMKCSTWLVRVRRADHGMNVKPPKGTKIVGEETGRVAAEWLKERDAARTECEISFDNGTVKRTEWVTDQRGGKVKIDDMEHAEKELAVHPEKARPHKRARDDGENFAVRRSLRLKTGII